MKYIIFPMMIIFIMGIQFSSCSQKTVLKNKCTQTPSGADKPPEKEFMKEGFINSDTYRVIIVSTKSECMEGIRSIERRAKKRALTSLKKYIQSTGKRYTPIVNTGIINLINDNGIFTRKDETCNRDLIFFYDIQKQNIRFHINTISNRE